MQSSSRCWLQSSLHINPLVHMIRTKHQVQLAGGSKGATCCLVVEASAAQAFLAESHGTCTSQASSDCLDLLRSLVAFDPARRPSAAVALQHAYFQQSPAPTPPAHLPKPKSRIEAPLRLPPQVIFCLG